MQLDQPEKKIQKQCYQEFFYFILKQCIEREGQNHRYEIGNKWLFYMGNTKHLKLSVKEACFIPTMTFKTINTE